MTTTAFGIRRHLAARDVDAMLRSLVQVLDTQVASAGVNLRDPLELDGASLADELQKFRTWFDPTAKGDRLRTEFARLPAVSRSSSVALPTEVIVPIGKDQHLVTPEGYLSIWMWGRARDRQAHANYQGDVEIDSADLEAARNSLLDLYRVWTRRRIDDVVGLLNSETSTLRPAAAGLLLTLLVNRNTSSERALRRPRDADQLRQVAEAIASPSLAFAETLSGRTTARSSVDLYRGWALGELRRRLGAGFHSHFDEGIWLDESATATAVERLIADVRRRDVRGRARVPAALDAALQAYDSQRPQLAALNLAFERPANTSYIRELLESAANERTSKS